MKFKNFIKDLEEEMTSGDIATVDNKLGSKSELQRSEGRHKGKKCKTHKRFDCLDCKKDNDE